MNPVTTDWGNFFVAEVGASAALAGLVVVAISINLSRIISLAHLPERAAEALMVLVGALVVTSAALVPNQSAALFGAEAMTIGVVTFVVPLVFQVRALNARLPRRYLRVLVGAAASLPFVVAGALLVLGSGAGFYWVAAGVIISLVAGVFDAWVLLVEILR